MADAREHPEALPWHEQPWAAAAQAITRDRVPHAWLIHGPPGVGKGQFARRLAAALLCHHPDADGQPCNTCSSCTHLRRETHPDFLHLTPEPDKQDISVDGVRQLTARLGLKAEGSRHRVALVEPADRLNLQAMNALLKTLEEPPGQGVLLLVCERPARLLPTIRSRCRALRIPAPDPKAGNAWLREAQPAVSPEAARTALAVVRGGPLDARRLLQEDGLAARQTAFDEWLAVTQNRRNPVAVAARWHEADPVQHLHWLHGWVLDLQRLQVAAPPPRLDNPDLADTLRPLADRLGAPGLSAYLRDMSEWLALFETTANRQLLVEQALIRWQSLALAEP